jgi:hypothetical protein
VTLVRNADLRSQKERSGRACEVPPPALAAGSPRPGTAPKSPGLCAGSTTWPVGVAQAGRASTRTDSRRTYGRAQEAVGWQSDSRRDSCSARVSEC